MRRLDKTAPLEVQLGERAREKEKWGWEVSWEFLRKPRFGDETTACLAEGSRYSTLPKRNDTGFHRDGMKICKGNSVESSSPQCPSWDCIMEGGSLVPCRELGL